MPDTGSWIWVNRWDEFQTYQTKRGKPWAPPWIKLYPKLLDNGAFLALTEHRRLLLLELFMLFPRCSLEVTSSTRWLSGVLSMRVTTSDLESLNHAGFIDLCSRTVLEQRRNTFRNCSNLEVEEEKNLGPYSLEETTRANGNGLSIELKEIPW